MTETTGEQQEFKFSTDWGFLKILNTMFDKGFVAQMTPAAFCVLCLLRKNTNPYKKGPPAWSYQSHASMAKVLGITKQTVKTSIDKLEELGWVKKHPRGRGYAYELTERVYAMSRYDGIEDRILQFPFEPASEQIRKKEIKTFEQTGKLPAGSPIVIQKIEINNPQIQIVNHADGSRAITIQASMEEIRKDTSLKPVIRDRIMSVLENKLLEASHELQNKIPDED
jgi:biotin operon repressor